MTNFVDLRTVEKSYVESFIDSYLELIKEHSFKELYDEYSWGIMTPNFYDENAPDEEQILFIIEDVEDWFNQKGVGATQSWTNSDAASLLYHGKQAHEYGYNGQELTHEPLKEYKGVKYMRVYNLFFMCETYLIELGGKVYSIWY